MLLCLGAAVVAACCRLPVLMQPRAGGSEHWWGRADPRSCGRSKGRMRPVGPLSSELRCVVVLLLPCLAKVQCNTGEKAGCS